MSMSPRVVPGVMAPFLESGTISGCYRAVNVVAIFWAGVILVA